MSDREKLIELYWHSEQLRFMRNSIETCVDYLISNGVTFGVDAKPLKQYLAQIDEYAGLKLKFLVFKADTGERIENCFVLRPDKDRAAVEALRAYAEATDNKTLSDDIYNWVGKGVTVQKWIPVSERLPKFGQQVLVSCAGYELDYVTAMNFWSAERDEWQSITHWMPLPEPPKECE